MLSFWNPPCIIARVFYANWITCHANQCSRIQDIKVFLNHRRTRITSVPLPFKLHHLILTAPSPTSDSKSSINTPQPNPLLSSSLTSPHPETLHYLPAVKNLTRTAVRWMMVLAVFGTISHSVCSSISAGLKLRDSMAVICSRTVLWMQGSYSPVKVYVQVYISCSRYTLFGLILRF
jgi:hypothetical protein